MPNIVLRRQTYYNENDPRAAEWLRELIRNKVIPPGDVDERSIREVRAADVGKYHTCHFFAGIGGWAEALRLAGWPTDQPIWTGSCPCQPFSTAGRRQGAADDRHLWPEFARLIAECRPPVCVGEQVASKDGRAWLAGVRTDLEGMGYRVGAADLCAAGEGAPHIRQRLYWVADTGHWKLGWTCKCKSGSRSPGERLETAILTERCSSSCRLADPDGRIAGNRGVQRGGEHRQRAADSGVGRGVGDTDGAGLEGRRLRGSGRADERAAGSAGGPPADDFWTPYDLIPCRDGRARRVEPGTFPLVDGLPGRVGLLRGYGNAIVPQVAAAFLEAYLDVRDGDADGSRGDSVE